MAKNTPRSAGQPNPRVNSCASLTSKHWTPIVWNLKTNNGCPHITNFTAKRPGSAGALRPLRGCSVSDFLFRRTDSSAQRGERLNVGVGVAIGIEFFIENRRNFGHPMSSPEENDSLQMPAMRKIKGIPKKEDDTYQSCASLKMEFQDTYYLSS